MADYAWLAILTLAQIIQFLVMKRNGKGVKYNPHPPGESDKCIKHGELLSSLKTEIENIKDRLGRIEGKLNGRIKL